MKTWNQLYQELWEQGIDEEKICLQYKKGDRRPYDPMFERNKKRRRREEGSDWRYNKENTYNQKLSWRLYRREMKLLIAQQQYEKVRPFQKTQGWWTW